MADRWSTETEELVAGAVGGPHHHGEAGGCEDCLFTARAVLGALADAGLLAPMPDKGPCSCAGRRWVVDRNWRTSTDNYRRPGDGLIPCGFCNEGGWSVEEWEGTR